MEEHNRREQDLRELNERLDREKDALVREASNAVREQAERLARMPEGIDAVRLSRELRRTEAVSAGAMVEVLEEGEELENLPANLPAASSEDDGGEPELLVADVMTGPNAATSTTAGRRGSSSRPGSAARPSSGATRGSARPGSAAVAQLPPMNPTAGAEDESLGNEASARYQKAQLTVTLEELERLRGLLAAKSATVAEAEASVRELQQRVSKLERAERAMQVTLENERTAGVEARRRSEALEHELGMLRKESSDSARREKSSGAEQRSKDVRLNRALEELERTRGQLRQLREERESAGSGARGEAARLAAENTRLRKRQSELLLAFKKQAKLIDVLKRQKLHVEAATLLSFTEAEFSRTLELGEALA